MSNSSEYDMWGGQNPLPCCHFNLTEGGRPTHGGPDCQWPGDIRLDTRGNVIESA